MRDFPKANIYEHFFEFMPWGILINKLLSALQETVPENSRVLDIMCGPGYLLGELYERRKDLILEGIDLNEAFIEYAKAKQLPISFQVADVLSWNPTKKYDVILSTGGIHHLTNENKVLFFDEIPKFLNKDGVLIIADPYLDDFENDLERKVAAAKLGYEYLIATIKNNSTDDVIGAAIDIMYNDVLQLEYKTSLNKILPILYNHFSEIEVTKTWPEHESGFGDYYIFCKKAK